MKKKQKRARSFVVWASSRLTAACLPLGAGSLLVAVAVMVSRSDGRELGTAGSGCLAAGGKTDCVGEGMDGDGEEGIKGDSATQRKKGSAMAATVARCWPPILAKKRGGRRWRRAVDRRI